MATTPSTTPDTAPSDLTSSGAPAPAARRTSMVSAFLRGGAVGATEALPGISGGTVALIVRLYDDLIAGAGQVVSGLKAAVTDGLAGRGLGRAKQKWAKAPWGVLLPALVGMATFLLMAMLVIAPLVENHTQYAYAVFFGLVLASLWIPFSGAGHWRLRDWMTALFFAAASFALVSLPAATLPPTTPVVFFAAAVAICALVLPGVSGSFLLLLVGLYEPTLAAVRNLDLGYIGTFAAGAVLGLALFVKLLQYLLAHRRHVTLVVLTGLMAGSLRALWPWQAEDRSFVAPTEIPLTLLFVALGFVVVTAALVWEHRTTRAKASAPSVV